MPSTETIHDKITKAFIDENYRDIVLSRRKKEKTSAGGFRMLPDSFLLPQKGRFISSSAKGNQKAVTLPEGRIVTPVGIIVFMKDADVERHDTTSIDGKDYEIVEVIHGPWSTEASVTNHAE